MITSYYYYWGGGAGRGIRLKNVGKKKKKKALKGKRFIYYNKPHRVTYKNPVRKIKPSKIKINLIIKSNNNRQTKKLPGAITLNMAGLINPGITINRNLKDLIILRGYKTQNTINQ